MVSGAMRRGAFLALLAAAAQAADSGNWPMFRGESALGVVEGPAPVSWNADPGAGPMRNLKWKTPIPGLGHSSPVIWGNKLFVATAVSAAGAAPLRVGIYGDGDAANDNGEQSWKVYCLDKRTGKVLWERTAYQGVPRSKRHTKGTHANTTAAVDGKRLSVFFGSEGLYVYDLDGRLLWSKDFGVVDQGPKGYDLSWGFASSPVLFEDKVIVQCDRRGEPFAAAFSAADGKQLWRTSRAGVADHGWATPGVIRAGGRALAVLNAWPFIAAYDVETGKERWRLRSAGDIPAPTPILARGLIFVTNAHGGGAPLYAIKPGAEGDITPVGDARTSAGVAWSEPRNGAYMQTPLVAGDLLYSCSDRGVLKVYDAASGTLHYQQRLGAGTTGFSASPVAAGGRVYFTSEEGEVYVIKAGSKFELLAENRMGEIAMASPAISEGALFFRTRGHVVAIAAQDSPKTRAAVP
jgi:outer membrane protein assembly factor BamB